MTPLDIPLPPPPNGRRRSVVAAVAFALFVALLECPAGADGPVSPLRLSITPALVSVEGKGVRVSEVLVAVGAKAGFTVTGIGSDRLVDHLSVQGPTIADVVRQLLRHEDHAVVYRDDAGSAPRPIDTIVLLGSRALSAPGPSSGRGTDGIDGASTRSAGIASGPALSTAAGPEPPGQANRVASDTDGRLGMLLRTHARPGSVPEPAEDQAATGGVASSAGDRSGTTPSSGGRGEMAGPSADQDLAAATRKAQENLRTLIEGLGAASRSLLQPPPSSR
jgi:hypothetical protein